MWFSCRHGPNRWVGLGDAVTPSAWFYFFFFFSLGWVHYHNYGRLGVEDSRETETEKAAYVSVILNVGPWGLCAGIGVLVFDDRRFASVWVEKCEVIVMAVRHNSKGLIDDKSVAAEQS
ncbi:hypothetical protein BDV06DRAFT_205184 [Aspergillus oleicola]